jgi:hypothetical protein
MIEEPEKKRAALTKVSMKQNSMIRKDARKLGAGTTRTTEGSETPEPTQQNPHPYNLWDPSYVARELSITCGKKGLPNLNDDNVMYDALCEPTITADKKLHPPGNVHLSCKWVGYLLDLLRRGLATVAYLNDTWPHVFNSKGAVHKNRHPQGEPSVLHNNGEL